MKNLREKRQAQVLKNRKAIWKSLNIERTVKVFGYAEVKSAVSQWLNLQRSRASLEKKKAELEKELKEVSKKL